MNESPEFLRTGGTIEDLDRVRFRLRIARHQLLSNHHGRFNGSNGFPAAQQTFSYLSHEAQDLLTCRELEYYDKQYERVTVKNERRLQRVDRIFRIFHRVKVTTC